MILVLGGGFGLYGHLPALVAAGHDVAAPARYRPLAQARPELAPIVPRVTWVEDEREACRRAASVTLARRPDDNADMVQWALAGGTEARLVIEKPIAPDWRTAAALELALVDHGRRWAVPYLFLYCDWFQTVAAAIDEGRSVRINWTHLQSPAVRGWKKVASEGGGAAAFYFIHMLALIEAVLPAETTDFRHRTDHDGELITADTARFGIRFHLADAMRFRVMVDDRTIFDESSPFGPAPLAGMPDPRISPLRRFYADIDRPDARGADFHRAVTSRWQALAGTS